MAGKVNYIKILKLVVLYIGLASLLLVICGFKSPPESRWSDEVVGEVILDDDMTLGDAKKLCKNRAMIAAIEQVAGVKIQSETFVKDSMMTDYVNTQSYAWVKEVKEERWEEEVVQKGTNGIPKHLYRVRLKALIAMDRDRDEGFTLKLDLNRIDYEEGDEMVMSLQVGQDCYLSIFNVLEDESVTPLLPNSYRTDRFVRMGDKIKFPDPDKIGNAKKLKLKKTSQIPEAKEAILVIATKDDIDLVEGNFKQTLLLRDLLENVTNIPAKDRSMTIKYYLIRDGKKQVKAFLQ
jgi:hypothetical protein